jgi:hypothetical protein
MRVSQAENKKFYLSGMIFAINGRKNWQAFGVISRFITKKPQPMLWFLSFSNVSTE